MTGLLERLNAALSGRYSVDSEIGRGGMATVFLAEDVRHRRKVAIKVMNPEISSDVGTERFFREIEIVAGLTHPHILPLYDSGQADGLLYCVMPYIEGESLLEYLQTEKQLVVDEAVRIATEVAEALGYAHEQGIIHRDIKPANILLEQGHAVVADFGIARAVEQAGGARLTQTGVAVGTPAYMSPEQGTGSGDLDGRTDIYALGCVLYEMLAGDPPYTGVTPLSVIKRHALEPVPNVRTVRETTPESVEYAITRAMAKVPADRFKTAGEFAAALTAPVPRTAAGKRRLRTAVLAAVAVVAALVVGWQLAGRFRTSDSEPMPSDAELREIRVTQSGRMQHAALSDDGELVAYTERLGPFRQDQQDSPPEGFNLMVSRVADADSAEAQLIMPVEGLYDLDWKPDGSMLVVSGRIRGRAGLFLVPPFGGRETTRLDSKLYSIVEWEPGGDRLAVVDRSGSTIQVLGGIDRGTAEAVAPEAEFDRIDHLAWSPSGEKLAVSGFRGGLGGKVEIWSIALEGGDQQHLATEDVVGGIAWATSRDALYYARTFPNGEIIRLPVSAGGSVAGNPEALTRGCMGLGEVSADGRRVLCARSSKSGTLWLKSADPAIDSVLVAEDSLTKVGLGVSPDGRQVAYAARGPSGLDLHVMEIATGESRQITNRGDLVNLYTPWSPDGKYIAYRTFGDPGDSNIWFVASEGGPSVRAAGVVAGYGLTWAPSPDPIVSIPDNRNYVILEPPGDSWDSALASGELTGIATRRLAPESPSDSQMVNATVSPDRSRVAVFWKRGSEVGGGDETRRDAGIWILSLDGTARDLVYRWRAGTGRPKPVGWTAGGDSLYVHLGPETHLLSVATGETRYVATPGANCTPPVPGDGRFLCTEDSAIDAYVLENFDPHGGAVEDVAPETAGRERREIQLTYSGRVMGVAYAPDGEHVAYAETVGPLDFDNQSEPPGGFRLKVARVQGTEGLLDERVVGSLQAMRTLAWTPDGSLITVSGKMRDAEGTFLVPPFGGGQPSRLTPGQFLDIDWAPAGDFAVASNWGRSIAIIERGADGTGEVSRIQLESEIDRIQPVAWSPDADRIVAAADSAGVMVFWTLSPDGTNQRRLGVEEGNINIVDWAPGGDALYYSRLGPTGEEFVRRALNDDGGFTGTPEVLADYPGLLPTADGSRAVGARYESKAALWVKVAGAGSDSTQLTADSVSARSHAVSPDGRYVAYHQGVAAGSDLFVIPVDGGEAVRLTYAGNVTNGRNVLAWSPDGRFIAYLARALDGTRGVRVVSSTGGRSILVEGIVADQDMLVWAAGRHPMIRAQTPEELNFQVLEPIVPWDSALLSGFATSDVRARPLISSENRVWVTHATVSPDGRLVAAYWRRGPRLADGGCCRDSGIWIISLSESTERLLYRTSLGTSPRELRWTEDGSGVYLSREGQTHLVDLETGDVSLVAEPGPYCSGPLPGGDGRFVCSRADERLDLWLIENFDPHAGP